MSMSVMNMNSELLKGMSEMISDIVSKAVRHCGEVHNFDAEEMLRKMNVMDLSISVCVEKSKPLKKKENKVVVKSKLALPFSGELKEGCCQALRQNHGLYTQCETEVKDEMYCNKCGPSPEYGTIEDRLKVGLMEFRDPKGKAPTHFTKVMKKLKISREEVEEEAGKLNIIINDIHFSEEKIDKKEKGRPKKPKRKIELADDSTDLFAVLVAKANEESEEEESADDKLSIAENIVDTVLDKVSVIAENNEKKTEKETEKAEKEALKLAEKQKKETEKAEKEALKLAEKQKKETEKAEKEALKLAEKQKKETEKANKPVAKATKSKKETSDSETEKKKSKPAEKKVSKEVEEEEEDVVKRFEFEGVKYLKSKKTGIIYNMDQDVIGKWNEKTNKIDFEEAGSEEEEDEYDA